MDALVRPSIADGRGRPSHDFVLGQVLISGEIVRTIAVTSLRMVASTVGRRRPVDRRLASRSSKTDNGKYPSRAARHDWNLLIEKQDPCTLWLRGPNPRRHS